MVEVALSARAEDDLLHLWLFIASESSVELADAMLDRIETSFRTALHRHPSLGRSRPELGDAIRTYPVAPYAVFYSASKSFVRIERVLHGSRDIRSPLLSLLVAS